MNYIQLSYLLNSLNLEQYLNLSLSFLTLSLFMSTGQVFCRTSLNLGLQITYSNFFCT